MLKKIIYESASYMAERFEKDPGYGFINTKFDIVTGRNFGAADEKFRQKDFIYSWIQGRGLESLTAHYYFFSESGNENLALKLQNMCRTVMENMEKLRSRNNGRIPFAMTPDGKTHFPVTGKYGNYSDLFYSKGLFAAAAMLKLPEIMKSGEELFRFVISEICDDNFRTDQHGFDPKNPVAFVPGKLMQGPRMIALGGLALFAAIKPDENFYLDKAAEFIDYICKFHLNTGKYADLEMWDFFEAVDSNRQPWFDGKVLLCDPGHALEFVGLAGKCLLEMRRQNRHPELIAKCKEILPHLFRHTFDLGFQNSNGIVKSFDLISRQPVNSDMPWWNLPETMRAGAEMIELYPDDTRDIAARIDLAEQAFLQNFITPGSHGFACQTIDFSGQPVNVIPAVPDADPGYHTNCSLLETFV